MAPEQPSLFDLPLGDPEHQGPGGAEQRTSELTLSGPSPGPEWREVPQALFLSWSDAMQLAYCARRDEDAMLGDDISGWWMDFYAERSLAYRRDLL